MSTENVVDGTERCGHGGQEIGRGYLVGVVDGGRELNHVADAVQSVKSNGKIWWILSEEEIMIIFSRAFSRRDIGLTRQLNRLLV